MSAVKATRSASGEASESRNKKTHVMATSTRFMSDWAALKPSSPRVYAV